jgi:hypothetical protein
MTTNDADRQLQDAARAMEAAPATGRSVTAVLKKRCPRIHGQLLQDARCPGLFALWGRSANFDENAKQIIVHPAILQAIGSLAGVAMRGRFVHAGLLHTYGYLFSLIETPYGAKRDRWLTTEMEQGLGLEKSLLGASPRAGTLLGNVSYLLGRIGLGSSRRLRALEETKGAIAPELIDYQYSHLHKDRVVEVIQFEGSRTVTIFTDLVLYASPLASMRESTLLVYSVQTGTGPVRLVTAFPTSDEAASEIIKSVPAGGRGLVQLKYNAYLPGLYGRTPSGRRRLEKT